jgi:predicted protein tyrosine phosphatase
MSAITERRFLRLPAPAQRNSGTAIQVEALARRITDLEVRSLDSNRPVVLDCYLGFVRCHAASSLIAPTESQGKSIIL